MIEDAEAGRWPAPTAATAAEDERFWREIEAAEGPAGPAAPAAETGEAPDPEAERAAIQLGEMRAGLARERRA